jgi:hypothetical protein
MAQYLQPVDEDDEGHAGQVWSASLLTSSAGDAVFQTIFFQLRFSLRALNAASLRRPTLFV